ncbi:MAG: hypothetical protein HQM08_19940 [Candidatus Riflebacteria bacterium]|nr:hypothetical protein [Candidatus Riflebacteria bacterium]
MYKNIIDRLNKLNPPSKSNPQPANAMANRGDDLRRGGSKRSLRTTRSQVNCLVLAHIVRQIKAIDEVIAAILRDRVAQNVQFTCEVRCNRLVGETFD